MKILYLDHFSFHGGAQDYLLDIAQEIQSREGYQVWLPTSSIPSINDRVKKISPKCQRSFGGTKNPLRLWSEMRYWSTLIRKEKIDLLHCNSIPSLLFGWWAKKRFKIPLLYTAHDCNLASSKLTLVREIPQQIIAVSATVQSYLRENGATQPIAIISNGLSDFTAHHQKRETFRVVLPGRVVPTKGLELFIDAAEKLLPRYRHLEMVIRGDGESKSYVEQIKAKCSQIERLSLEPFLSSKSELYGDADLIVNASTYLEPLGRTLIEAGVAKLPVIGPNRGGPCEIIQEGENGFLFQSGSAESLAHSIERVVVMGGEERQKMGERGRELYLKNHTAQSVADQLIALYQKALTV